MGCLSFITTYAMTEINLLVAPGFSKLRGEGHRKLYLSISDRATRIGSKTIKLILSVIIEGQINFLFSDNYFIMNTIHQICVFI